MVDRPEFDPVDLHRKADHECGEEVLEVLKANSRQYHGTM